MNECCLQNKPCIVYTDHSFNTLLWKAALVCFKLKCKHSFASSIPLMPKSVCWCVCPSVSLCVCASLCVRVFVFVWLCLWLNSSIPSWLVFCLQHPASPLWCLSLFACAFLPLYLWAFVCLCGFVFLSLCVCVCDLTHLFQVGLCSASSSQPVSFDAAESGNT